MLELSKALSMQMTIKAIFLLGCTLRYSVKHSQSEHVDLPVVYSLIDKTFSMFDAQPPSANSVWQLQRRVIMALLCSVILVTEIIYLNLISQRRASLWLGGGIDPFPILNETLWPFLK